ncbi:MAG: glycosyltransferase [Verrucomicrobiota bacterium]|nr:glycosyltransferase [Verrucomicrobiota bacterium]
MTRRILHVITGIDRGGAENHLLDLVKHQRAMGMEVEVAYLRGQGYWAGALTQLGARVHRLGLRFYGDLAPLLRLRRLIKNSALSLVHAHLPPSELYSRLALLGVSARSLPLLITKHNDERFYEGPGQRLMGRWVARRAGFVIAISEAVKKYMGGTGLGIDLRKIHTIVYGIDAEPFARVPSAEVALARKKWGIAGDAMVIGFVGRLVDQKDLDTLIRGFALFAPSVPNARLVIVGRGPLETRLRELTSELAIEDRVVWAGFRDDIGVVMNAFDVFALTSLYEGFGLVLLEAMASRRAVIATRVSAVPEVVLDGETGLLITSRHPIELAAAFKKVTDRFFRVQLGEAGARRVNHAFTLQAMCQKTDTLYARCLQAGSPGSHNKIPCAVTTVL